ncbi:SAM-dependent methyltransferase [Sinosporangium siamense]|uniref:S-adenosyl methyltransferase n=1 Tax=Sinosporangium siamense TaxID=1367973 RepID=A0A919RR98_9ACTN|nr:SAM-dependent methyltransferase [Sinosporangium siamense]GII97031.1 hypothetical protein Ssi02_72620 [Sinosporangium siamense]
MKGIDSTVPHSARVWNYWLGGKDNYPVDREVGDQFAQIFPGIFDLARHSRYFMQRAVRYLVSEAGVRQFLDVGTGLPTVDNTHEVAQRANPECRIVYVDNDPLVLAHARALLTSTGEGSTDYIDSDLRNPERILDLAAATLDLTQPVGLILMQVMGHVTDDDEAHSIVRRLLDGLPPGSYLAFNDSVDTHKANAAATSESYNESGAIPYKLRSPAVLEQFFDGLELVNPGVVSVSHWRPDTAPVPTDVFALGGVAKKTH